jgi:hypothetical protein
MLRRSPLVECVSVLHGTGVYKASIFFYSSVYVQPCLSKNPKYTFYTTKNSLTLACKYNTVCFTVYIHCISSNCKNQMLDNRTHIVVGIFTGVIFPVIYIWVTMTIFLWPFFVICFKIWLFCFYTMAVTIAASTAFPFGAPDLILVSFLLLCGVTIARF